MPEFLFRLQGEIVGTAISLYFIGVRFLSQSATAEGDVRWGDCIMAVDRKDLGAGAIFIGTGLVYGGIALHGGLANPRLPLGRALSMGPGMFPVILSGLIIFIGLILVVRSLFAARATEFFGVISWRAIFTLSAAVILFGAYLREMGMLLAIFVTCFLSALASRHVKIAEAAITAAGLAILCTIVFGYGVKLPIPVIGTWFVN